MEPEEISTTRLSEDIPLKPKTTSHEWCKWNETCIGGSKFVNSTFGTLTVIITSALLVQINYGDYQVVPHGSVASDSLECSEIGTSILKIGGNSVDAAIATAFCLTVVTPYATGLDAEGQMLIYNHRKRDIPDLIDFSLMDNSQNRLPRLVIGLAYCHKKYSLLPWRQLVEPSAKLAAKGFFVSKMFRRSVQQAAAEDLYGSVEVGQLLQLKTLSNTLNTIANIPESELYKYIVNKPVFTKGTRFKFDNYDIFVSNLPSMGPTLLFILDQISKHNLTISKNIEDINLATLIEIIHTTFRDFNLSAKFHEGTSTNVAAIDLHDNYVSLVMGMSSLFGSGEMTSLGYVLDTRSNSSHSSRFPIIITEANICGKRIVLGANNVITATQILMSLLVYHNNATEAIESPRFHFATNGSLGIEGTHTPYFTENVLNNLRKLSSNILLTSEPYPSTNIIEKYIDNLNSHSDSRGGGIASRF